MIELGLKVFCDQHGCDNFIHILVDWSEVHIDLNEKKIIIPSHPIFARGWEERTAYSYCGGQDTDEHFCTEHKENR